jgi:hypothetical protein
MNLDEVTIVCRSIVGLLVGGIIYISVAEHPQSLTNLPYAVLLILVYAFVLEKMVKKKVSGEDLGAEDYKSLFLCLLLLLSFSEMHASLLTSFSSSQYVNGILQMCLSLSLLFLSYKVYKSKDPSQIFCKGASPLSPSSPSPPPNPNPPPPSSFSRDESPFLPSSSSLQSRKYPSSSLPSFPPYRRTPLTFPSLSNSLSRHDQRLNTIQHA